MPSDWREVDLSELAEIKHGFAFQGEMFRDDPPGDVLLTPGNFAIGGGFKGDKFKYYSGPVPAEYVLQHNDLLVSMTDLSKNGDTLGYPALVPLPKGGVRYLHNQRLGKVLIKDETQLSKRFLYYLMRTREYRNEIIASATGTTVKHTSPTRILKFRFMLPQPDDQRKIADILGTFDDKIELNRRTSETLEAIARALFKSWFVDFDPVRAKAEGRWREGKSLPGLPAHLYDLFPDSFDDSELGEVPKGWMVTKLEELIELRYGKALKEEDRKPGDVPVFGSNGIVGLHSERLVNGPGIVVGRKGNPGVIRWAPTDFFPIDTTFYVIPKSSTSFLHFLYFALRRQNFAALGSDSAVPGLNRSVALMSSQLLPSAPILEKFEESASPLFRRVHALREESNYLSQLRDALLPKLISGEIPIQNVGGDIS